MWQCGVRKEGFSITAAVFWKEPCGSTLTKTKSLTCLMRRINGTTVCTNRRRWKAVELGLTWLVCTCGLAGVVKWTNRGYDQDAVSSISLQMSPCYESSYFTTDDWHEPMVLGLSLPYEIDLRLEWNMDRTALVMNEAMLDSLTWWAWMTKNIVRLRVTGNERDHGHHSHVKY